MSVVHNWLGTYFIRLAVAVVVGGAGWMDHRDTEYLQGMEGSQKERDKLESGLVGWLVG